MTSPPYDEIPSPAEERLNRLLERWAAPRRLTGRQAEAVRLAIVDGPEALGNEWWQGFFGRVSEAIQRSHDAARTGPFVGHHAPPGIIPGWKGTGVKSESYRAYVRMG
jgi:hypothetical protein